MEMWKVYVKRSVPSASYLIEDLGIDIPATGYVELSNQFSYSEIADSDDLRVSVSAGVLILNNRHLKTKISQINHCSKQERQH